MDPFGHCVLEAFPEYFEKGYDIRPTIAGEENNNYIANTLNNSLIYFMMPR